MVSKNKTKKKTNKGIKRKLLNLQKDNDYVEEQRLNKAANNINDSQEIIVIIPCFEEIIKTQNKKTIWYTGEQGELLKKFKDTGNIFGNVGQSRSMIYFKILLYKFLKECLLLKTSSLQSSLLIITFFISACLGSIICKHLTLWSLYR